MAYALFVSDTYLKNNTPANIWSEDIYRFAKTAEDTYIQEAIGTCLYDRLIASRLTSPPDTTVDETVLIKKIREALIWYTCYDALPFVWVKIRNMGVIKQAGDNMESVSMAEMSFMQKQLKNKADFYMKLLQDYLCKNSTLFPDYNCSCATHAFGPSGKIPPSCSLAFDKNDC